MGCDRTFAGSDIRDAEESNGSIMRQFLPSVFSVVRGEILTQQTCDFSPSGLKSKSLGHVTRGYQVENAFRTSKSRLHPSGPVAANTFPLPSSSALCNLYRMAKTVLASTPMPIWRWPGDCLWQSRGRAFISLKSAEYCVACTERFAAWEFADEVPQIDGRNPAAN